MNVPEFLQRNHRRNFDMPVDLDEASPPSPYAPKPRTLPNGPARLSEEEMLAGVRNLAQITASKVRQPNDITPIQTIATMICELRYPDLKTMCEGLGVEIDKLYDWAGANKMAL